MTASARRIPHGLPRETAPMPLHAVWKGYLRVSLVSIPLRAVTASSGDGPSIRLNQLHARCKNRIRYKKTCPLHGEVPNDEIVSGYEFEKGQYVVIDPDEVAKLRPAGDKSLTLESFVPIGAIDPLYLAGQAYYLLPDGNVGQKAYALLQNALASEQLQGVGSVVISKRERLVRIRPLGQLLTMEVLQYDAEVKRPENYEDELEQTKSIAQELKLTRSLLAAMTQKEFDPAAYHDEYVGKLQQLIDARIEGREITAPAGSESRPVVNLMEALKASMKRVQTPGRKTRKQSSAKRSTSKRQKGGSRAPAPSAAARKTPAARKRAVT